MFIEVCIDVVNKALDSNDLDRDIAIETLRGLTIAVRKNRHAVFIPFLSTDLIHKLSNCLSKNEIVSLQYCFKKRRDLQALNGCLLIKCVVSFNEITRREKDVIYLNPKQETIFEFHEESHLLTENILDSDFYGCITKCYQKAVHINCGVFRTCFFPVQGGGSTIKDVYLLECRLGEHFCLCIMDSDKKWPNCSEFGQTAQEFRKALTNWENDNGEVVKCSYYVMQNASEIENLIPLSVLRHFSNIQSWNFIFNHRNIVQWFDLKKGIEYKILFNDEAYNEWKAVLPNEILWSQIDDIRSNSSDAQDFKQKVLESDLPNVVNPWGGRILEKVLHPDRRHTGKYNLYEIDLDCLLPEQKEEWLTIGAMVFSWCCCFSSKIV